MKDLWWCNSHGREATHTDPKTGARRCDPNKGGVTIPCFVVNLTGLCEIYDDGKGPRRRDAPLERG